MDTKWALIKPPGLHRIMVERTEKIKNKVRKMQLCMRMWETQWLDESQSTSLGTVSRRFGVDEEEKPGNVLVAWRRWSASTQVVRTKMCNSFLQQCQAESRKIIEMGQKYSWTLQEPSLLCPWSWLQLLAQGDKWLVKNKPMWLKGKQAKQIGFGLCLGVASSLFL